MVYCTYEGRSFLEAPFGQIQASLVTYPYCIQTTQECTLTPVELMKNTVLYPQRKHALPYFLPHSTTIRQYEHPLQPTHAATISLVAPAGSRNQHSDPSDLSVEILCSLVSCVCCDSLTLHHDAFTDSLIDGGGHDLGETLRGDLLCVCAPLLELEPIDAPGLSLV